MSTEAKRTPPLPNWIGTHGCITYTFVCEYYVQLSPCQLGQKTEQRRECAWHIKALHYHFDGASPSVFAAAIAVMDSALLKINVSLTRVLSNCCSCSCQENTTHSVL